jgi:hypothetical protein
MIFKLLNKKESKNSQKSMKSLVNGIAIALLFTFTACQQMNSIRLDDLKIEFRTV